MTDPAIAHNVRMSSADQNQIQIVGEFDKSKVIANLGRDVSIIPTSELKRVVAVSGRLPTKGDGPFVLAFTPWQNSSTVRNAKRRNPKRMTQPGDYSPWSVRHWRDFHNDIVWFTKWQRIEG